MVRLSLVSMATLFLVQVTVTGNTGDENLHQSRKFWELLTVASWRTLVNLRGADDVREKMSVRVKQVSSVKVTKQNKTKQNKTNHC